MLLQNKKTDGTLWLYIYYFTSEIIYRYLLLGILLYVECSSRRQFFQLMVLSQQKHRGIRYVNILRALPRPSG